MIIHSTEIEVFGEEVQISARVDSRPPLGVQSSGRLWFKFPVRFKNQISDYSDSFVVALLLVAMKNRENIEVRGTLSRGLLNGLSEYQKVFHSWFPERFHLIEVIPDGLRDDLPAVVDAGACAFSGGVDSFYTLIQNRSKITHTLFMAGFDMPLNLKGSIRELNDSYQELMSEWGIEFVSGSTNIRKFVNTVDWTNAHGSALIAAALFFKKSWGTFYIPSSYRSASYPKWGTHPELDPLLSTASMKIIHHGDGAHRLKKLEVIAQEPQSYHRLRVCWIQDIGLRNCSKCEKCMRTRIALDILGVLPSYSTFWSGALDRREVRNLFLRTHQGRLFARELMIEAFKRGRVETFLDLGYSLLRREFFFFRKTVGQSGWIRSQRAILVKVPRWLV